MSRTLGDGLQRQLVANGETIHFDGGDNYRGRITPTGTAVTPVAAASPDALVFVAMH